ncbi:alpha/beta fold hydrolase [Acinetobacter rudis]|uniref:Alpha/beta hydrolase n=1 Tax=Acinetobacter rudis TaxID=632955 RepID=A0AAW8J621_9GAMM|nr:alpha/beta hydrolase [Acinetobacter rudis]MDQ8934646.1 alpha/beta hydrolase [Acinetobacter rudis]MDQ8951589.1 alpha/beta hydrolase [Acinetobacter rudis]MDQ9016784.1 alpha/beta hydrolase [Acinetobacter rudis]
MNSTLRFDVSPYTPYMQEAKVDLGNGVQLHVEIGGKAEDPAIVLIMGLGAQLLFWPNFFCKLLIDRGFRVIRFDNRDIGLSTKISHSHKPRIRLQQMGRFALGLKNHGAPYNLHDMANDVVLLIDRLNLERPHLIGASMGGMIAQIVAAQHPDKISKLGILFSSNNQTMLPPPFPKQLASLLAKPKSRDENVIINHSLKVFQTIGSPGYIHQIDTLQTSRKLYQRSYYPTGVLQQFLAILCTGSLLHLDKKISTATLVVHGSRDRLLPPSHGKAIAKAISGAKFTLIEGMGHDIPPHFIPKLSSLFADHFQS